MFEYVLIEGLNDSKDNAEELSILLEGMLCFVNLIPYNGGLPLKAPTCRRSPLLKKSLKKTGSRLPGDTGSERTSILHADSLSMVFDFPGAFYLLRIRYLTFSQLLPVS